MIESPEVKFGFVDKIPVIPKSVFCARGSIILGDVEIGEESSVWFNTVLRGDVQFIRIGKQTNIQDLTMVHVSWGSYPTVIGDGVTIGHSCVIHACTIGNYSLVGMGSTILDGAELGEFVLLGAGSLVTQRTIIPPYSKAFGRPAKVVGKLADEEIEHLKFSAAHYARLGKRYLAEPVPTFPPLSPGK